MLKKSIISMAMVGAVALALASSGGGDKNKASVSPGISILKTTPGFSLRAGRSYSNEMSFRSKSNNFAINNTVLTYRKGNTIYILPANYRCTKVPGGKNNLNLLNVNVKLRK